MRKRSIILLTGAPGSGKGYLCDCLIDLLKENLECQIAIISTGDLIRKEIKEHSDLGNKIKAIIEAGQLVSDDIVAELVHQNLQNETASIIIFDGYPRTVNQTTDFNNIIDNMPVVHIHRETPKNIILKRVSKRRICSNCGKVQSSDNPDCCVCHGPLTVRKDDAVIQERLKVYEDETIAAIGAISEKYQGFILDGSEDAKDSLQEIKDSLLTML